MAAGGHANDATLRFRQRECDRYRCDQGALLMHLDCSCALVRPLDGQPHQSPSAGILYYPELLGFPLPENPSLVFASGGRGETARVRVGSPDHISPFDHAESTYNLHCAVRASPLTDMRARANSRLCMSRYPFRGRPCTRIFNVTKHV